MTDAMPARTEAIEAFTVGERIRVTRGALAGLEGTVAAFSGSRRCVLALNGVAPGVQIVIAADALERATNAADRPWAR